MMEATITASRRLGGGDEVRELTEELRSAVVVVEGKKMRNSITLLPMVSAQKMAPGLVIDVHEHKARPLAPNLPHSQ